MHTLFKMLRSRRLLLIFAGSEQLCDWLCLRVGNHPFHGWCTTKPSTCQSIQSKLFSDPSFCVRSLKDVWHFQYRCQYSLVNGFVCLYGTSNSPTRAGTFSSTDLECQKWTTATLLTKWNQPLWRKAIDGGYFWFSSFFLLALPYQEPCFRKYQ